VTQSPTWLTGRPSAAPRVGPTYGWLEAPLLRSVFIEAGLVQALAPIGDLKSAIQAAGDDGGFAR